MSFGPIHAQVSRISCNKESINQKSRSYKSWKIDGNLVKIQIVIFILPDKIAFEEKRPFTDCSLSVISKNRYVSDALGAKTTLIGKFAHLSGPIVQKLL